jgi:mediator of RNA polymerase II transcription subunit 7
MAWAPNPPNFYKQFTTANLERLEQWKKEHASSSSTAAEGITSQILRLPPELRYLVPPEPPSSGDYRLFGQYRTTRDYLRPLTESEIPQLYPLSTSAGASSDWTLDRSLYLKNLTRSIMLSFLELTGILSQSLSDAARKQDEVKTMYVNALHLINEYRPHQARESLILRMEEEVEKGRKEVEDVRKLKERVEALVEVGGGAGDVVVNGRGSDEPASMNAAKSEDQRELEVQKAIWGVLERDFPKQEG